MMLQIQKLVISGGNFKPDTLKPKEVVSLLLDDDELVQKCKLISCKYSKSIDVSIVSTLDHLKVEGTGKNDEPKEDKKRKNTNQHKVTKSRFTKQFFFNTYQ